LNTCTHTHSHTLTHTPTHTLTHTRTHTPTHTLTHTRTHTLPRLQLWEEQLGSMQAVLDGLLRCQATWLYLEPIFSSQDIVAQMPEEGRKFSVVDGYWRDVMTEAVRSTHTRTRTRMHTITCTLSLTGLTCAASQVRDPHVLAATAQPNMLERLQESNVLLEEIQKGLNNYLEMKRLYFPRSYSCSFSSVCRRVIGCPT